MKRFKFSFSADPKSEIQSSDFFNTASTLFSFQSPQFIPTQNESLYTPLRGYLVFGRFLGIIPLQGVFSTDVQNLRIRYFSLPYIISCSITLLLIFCVAVSTVTMIKAPKHNPADVAYSVAQMTFFLYATFVYIFFIRNSKQLVLLLQQWQSVNLYFTKEDWRLRRHFTMIIGIIFTSAILENVVFHLKLFPVFDPAISTSSNDLTKVNKKSALEVYFDREYGSWKDLISYNPFLTILLFLANKFAIYAWNYADIFIALISRAFYFKFKILTETAEEQLILVYGNKQAECLLWNLVAEDHNTLCNILEKFADFLEQLIFASYSINIYVTCLLVHQAFTPSFNTSGAATLYAAWSFFQITGRTFTFSLAAARVNEFAHGVRKLYAKCPTECYSMDVKRSEIRVASSGSSIAFHGLQCFFITKEYLLKIVSVIFTFEIVLLQSNAATVTCQNVTSAGK